MKPIPLSHALGTLAVSFDRHQLSGMQMSGDQCRDFAAMCRLLTRRAADLEAAEDELLNVVGFARDLDLIDEGLPHLGQMRRVVARDAVALPGSNIIAWPQARPDRPTGGDAA